MYLLQRAAPVNLVVKCKPPREIMEKLDVRFNKTSNAKQLLI